MLVELLTFQLFCRKYIRHPYGLSWHDVTTERYAGSRAGDGSNKAGRRGEFRVMIAMHHH